MTNNLSVVDAHVVAGGDDWFQLKISIEECHNLVELVPQSASEEGSNDASSSPSSATQYWLSYRCFQKVIQSELFSIEDAHSAAFLPSMQTFRVKFKELTSYFNDKKNLTLRIHLCTDGNVIATAFVDLGQLIILDKTVVLDALKVRNEYTFKPRTKESDQTSSCARVAVALSFDRHSVASAGMNDKQHQQQLLLPPTSTEILQTSSVPLETSPKQIKIKKEVVKAEEEAAKIQDEVEEERENRRCSNVDDANDAKCLREAQLLEREAQLQVREDQVSKREEQLHESLTSLENRRLEWEQSKHQDALTFQEKLRNKEAEMISAIEERIMLNESERLASVEKQMSDYEQLEKRLTKAILDVEAKDRTLKEQQGCFQHEYNRKLAELELKEKLIKQEMKHTIEIEQAKATAAFEQAVLAKKDAAAAAKKVKQIETEMDELREKHRKTPEALLVQQLAEIKGQLADSERRVEAMKVEKNQIVQDKEKFRINVRQLAKALRQERDKAVKRKEESHQNVHLSYDDSSGQFVLGGNEPEVHRILQDLSKLTQKQGSPVPIPIPSRPLGMDEVLDSINLSFLNEAKHCSN